MPDPDLEIRDKGGVGGVGGSPVIQTLRKGGTGSPKKFFRPWSKNKGGGGPGPPGPSPESATATTSLFSINISIHGVTD